MKVRYLIAAASAAVLVSPFAMANDPAGSADKSCATLQTQFDKDVTAASSANVGQAQSLREQGAKLCAEGKSAEGTAKLKEALSLIQGAKPAQPQS